MKRNRQTAVFLLCSILLLGIRGWTDHSHPSKERAAEAYVSANHMGKMEEILLERQTEEGILLLAKAERGLGYLTLQAEKGLFGERYDIVSLGDAGWTFFEDGTAAQFVLSLEEVFGYTELAEIERLVCYTGENAETCEVMTLFPDENGLFTEAESRREVIDLTGGIYAPGKGQHSWGFGERHIYAVEGLNPEGERIYWFSKYGFVPEDFAEKGLTKKIYDRVVHVE